MKMPYPIHPARRYQRGITAGDIIRAVAIAVASFGFLWLATWIACELRNTLN